MLGVLQWVARLVLGAALGFAAGLSSLALAATAVAVAFGSLIGWGYVVGGLLYTPEGEREWWQVGILERPPVARCVRSWRDVGCTRPASGVTRRTRSHGRSGAHSGLSGGDCARPAASR